MNIKINPEELIKANIISEDTSQKIQLFYKNKENSTTNRLFIVFGVLGAILVGLGIILIIAHNWDELSRANKTILSFIPLAIGQGLSFYSLLKKQNSIAWKESSSVFLFFSVGASISLISQIYNIPGNISSFVITWMLLILPLAYLMKSTIVSLFYIVGISYFAAETGYFSYSVPETYFYWGLILLIIPFYYFLFKKDKNSNSVIFHNWLIPISLIIALGTLAKTHEEIMFIAYFSLFGTFYLLGNIKIFSQNKLRNNPFIVLGSVGTIVLMIILSFNDIWKDIIISKYNLTDIIFSPELLVTILITTIASLLLYLHIKNRKLTDIKPIAPMFIIFAITFIIGTFSPIAVFLINIFVFAIGILTIREGAKQNHLGILNYGLLIISALVISRFFDTNISFVLRGLLFVSVGVGFFLTNLWMLKKRKNEN